MTTVHPFAGLRYNPALIQDMADVISPPYDKVSPAEREILWNRSEHNVVRLILPPPSGKDTDVATQSMDAESMEWYQESSRRLQEWIHSGVLQTDSPQLYVYHQTYSYGGEIRTRSGVFGALQLGQGTGPHAHEHTFEGPKADRLRLTRATKTNLSSIFLLADGSRSEWESLFHDATHTLLDFYDHDGQRHILQSLSDQIALDRAREFLRQRTLVIADGHHRYETAVNYCREMMQSTGKDPEKEPWGSVLSFMVPIQSPGLIVLPTHRVLSDLPQGWMDRLRSKTEIHCVFTRLERITGDSVYNALSKYPGGNAIALVTHNEAWFIVFKDVEMIPELKEVPQALRGLNVTLLHKFIFEHCLGLDQEALQSRTKYLRGEESAIELVKNGGAEAAFLLYSIPPSHVFEVSQQGVRMPQKSTDFYPKIPTGLVLRSLSGSEG